MFIFDKSFFHKVGAYFFPEKSSDFKWKESGSIDAKLCLFVSSFRAWNGVSPNFLNSIKVWLSLQEKEKLKEAKEQFSE